MTSTLRRVLPATLAALILPVSFVATQHSAVAAISAEPMSWGTQDGKAVHLYTLKNAAGMEVTITNYGGTVTSVKVKDKSGKFSNVVLGFDSLAGYTQKANTSYFGATIGRYANRLAHGTFSLDGQTFHIPTNESGNTLHGGIKGFDKVVWDVVSAPTASKPQLQLHYLSKDGEQGFPGNLNVNVTFSVTTANELRIEYRATTDKDTVLNLTNHSYWNLSGPGSGTVLEDSIMLAADRYTPVAKDLIPTGELAPVAGTPFDFRKPVKIGARIGDNNQQLKFANGYDQNWVLNRKGSSLTLAARVEDPKSGRTLEVLTTQPGIQFYTGNFLNGSVSGVGGAFQFRSALCLETQHYPDTPNHPNFPTAELKPGERFDQTTVYRFSVQ